MNKIKTIFILAIFASTTFTSCEKESEETLSTGIKYVVSLRNQASSESTADYLLLIDDLMSGEITAVGQGVELVGWNYADKFGDTFFAFGYTDNECIGYKEVDSTLKSQGKLSFDRMDMLSAINDETFLAIGAPWGGGSFNCELQLVNIENILISTSVEHPIYESFYTDSDTSYQLNAWPTFGYVENNQLFVFFYPLDGITWETPNTDTAYCSIFSYPELTYIKTIKDSRTSPIGYYATQPCVITDEYGNHYTFSSSSLVAGFTQSTKPSGILRIKAGEEEFDEDYFFNVEDAFGYKILTAAYVSDGKVVANVVNTENDIADNSWAAFSVTSPLLETAILDLENQTFTLVNEVPAHGGQYRTPMLLENDKVYLSVNNGNEAYIYEVDANTATATKGALIIGNEVQSILLNE